LKNKVKVKGKVPRNKNDGSEGWGEEVFIYSFPTSALEGVGG
jgi:hypothetical protein